MCDFDHSSGPLRPWFSPSGFACLSTRGGWCLPAVSVGRVQEREGVGGTRLALGPQGPCAITPAVPAEVCCTALLVAVVARKLEFNRPRNTCTTCDGHSVCQRGERASSTQNTPSEPGVQVPSPHSRSPRGSISPDTVPPIPR